MPRFHHYAMYTCKKPVFVSLKYTKIEKKIGDGIPQFLFIWRNVSFSFLFKCKFYQVKYCWLTVFLYTFFISTLIISSHSLLPSQFLLRNLLIDFGDFLHVKSSFSLDVTSYLFNFNIWCLIIICLGEVFFGLNLVEGLQASCTWTSIIFFSIFGKISAITSSNKLSYSFFILLKILKYRCYCS